MLLVVDDRAPLVSFHELVCHPTYKLLPPDLQESRTFVAENVLELT